MEAVTLWNWLRRNNMVCKMVWKIIVMILVIVEGRAMAVTRSHQVGLLG